MKGVMTKVYMMVMRQATTLVIAMAKRAAIIGVTVMAMKKVMTLAFR